MNNILAIWQALSARKKVALVLATLAVFTATLAVGRLAAKPSLSLLYAGLDPAAAGAVMAALEGESATYEVRGDAIFVEASRRDALRLSLAAQRLPEGGAAGYELLDGLSGFATTSQMFDAAYWRAKEGELARTIVASPNIRAARVHIAVPTGTALRRSAKPSASVTLTSAGSPVSPEQATGLRHLIASAVSGLALEDVSVIDDVKGLIGAPEEQAASSREEAIRLNVERLLDAAVGRGKAVVEVALELSTEAETVTERTPDPQSRVTVSTDTSESSEQGKSGGGDVTVASNLPDQGGGAAPGQSSQSSETREKSNFDFGERRREIVKPAGSIRRMTVAVVVDGVTTIGADGTETWAARTEEDLAVIRALVESAVGFNAERGDVVTVKSMPFEKPPEGALVAEPGLLSDAFADIGSWIRLVVLSLVALVLGLFVVRPILSARATSLPTPAQEPPVVSLPVLTGEVEQDFSSDLPALPGFDGGFGSGFAMGMGDFGGQGSSGADDAVARLRRLMDERKDDTAEILRSWIDDDSREAA